MYSLMVRIGKKTLRGSSLSHRKTFLIKRASITAAAISVVYVLSSAPHAVVLSLILSCKTGHLSRNFCDKQRKRLNLLYLLAVQV